MLVFGLQSGESAAALAAFVKQTGVTFPIVADKNYTLSKFAFPAGVGYPYPRDVVVDKNLHVRAIRNSYNAKEVEALVQKLLAEKVTP